MRASVTACVALAPRFAPLPSRRRVPRKPQPGSYTQWRVAASLDGPELPSEVEAKRLQLQKKRRYINITGFPFPLTPLLSRVTVCQELVSGKVWTFEQEQGIGLGLGVSTSVVMTVVKLKDGTLWVHNPIAPTEEMLDLLRSRCGGDDVNAAGDKGTASNKKYITVKYIVLATTQYEHKIFVGPFSRRFPRAQVWVAPGQFSFPVNLPNAFFGIFPTGVLSVDGVGMPWRDEIHQKLLILPTLFWNQYTFCECAFLHRDTGTLLVTDAAVFVDETHPEVIPSETLVDLGDEYGFTISLLRFGNYRNARSLPGAGDFSRFTDTERTQKTGWYRMFHRQAVWEWAQSIKTDWGEATELIVGGHFPPYRGNSSFQNTNANAEKSKSEAVDKFVEAFQWANTLTEFPKEYVDPNDLKSLQVLVKVLRFLKAVPPES